MQKTSEKVDLKEIFDEIDGMRDYVLQLQQNMTKLPAISPASGGKGEYQKAKYLEAELKKLKFDEITRIDAPDKTAENSIRPNIIAKYYGEDKSRTLWLMAHTDIVPEGDLSLWQTNPFEMVLDADGDTIYGRGVEDNNQAVVVAFLTARALMDLGKRPPINLGIMLLADEEVGSEYGIKYLVKNHRDLFGANDSFIVQDSGDPKSEGIEIAEKSVYWLKFSTAGKQAHGSRPSDGNNAFVAGAALALRLRETLYAKFDKRDPLFDPDCSTFEPTKKEANVPSINIIPGSDVFYMDCRVLPCYDVNDVRAEIDRIVGSVEDEFKVQVKIDVHQLMSSPATPADDPMVKCYIDAVKIVNGSGVEPKTVGIGGGTFAAYVRALGLSAVVAGRIYENPHTPNEKASIKFALSDAKVISHVLMNLK
ncbi:MAG: M20 family metallo-hydrolase [Elusimicrobiota bacterium]|nr:M20 family metallo-hydrolase [Elusimicrobiota bacterium]